MAQKIVAEIKGKWDPTLRPECDGLDLTDEQKRENEVAFRSGGKITFDPNVEIYGDDTSIVFRVFTDLRYYLDYIYRFGISIPYRFILIIFTG